MENKILILCPILPKLSFFVFTFLPYLSQACIVTHGDTLSNSDDISISILTLILYTKGFSIKLCSLRYSAGNFL